MPDPGANACQTAAVLCGFGGYVPHSTLANAELAERFAVDPEWILQRTGIAERRVVEPGGATSDLAVHAGRAALAMADGPPPDAIVLATSTPDHVTPATAPDVADRLGLGGAAAFDVGAVCSGFVYGLATATGLIRGGVARRVLLIGADTYTTVVDPLDRGAAILFGDGAGAVVVRAGTPDEPGAVGEFDLGSDGAHKDLILMPAGGSRQRSSGAQLPPDTQRTHRYARVVGNEVFRNAVRRMTASSRAVLDAAGWPPDQVDHVVPHQANARITRAVAEHLGVPRDRFLSNIERVGNTAGASIPLLLAHAAAERRLAAGALVLLTAFGGGLTWGSATLTWPALTP
ncbi:beta-ketoacyl-ACP synthase III [Streptomyces sp. Je 1-369]|uniref:beta-ketoacyl-ACP synthase III n=1 Tax=Streptomyces sp. Je 1-369 TaxID=2966192 RepID=UPI00228669C3|nr:beta-ketoacyl-ACP synthase III [Streptomyces sp. Je 1-369]WAL93211.1 ketoacyl-ACP synthase III [Streptomyces sp. Je 1-369]